MNIQFVSDVHLESKGRVGTWWNRAIVPQTSCLVLAGDICPVRHQLLPIFYSWCTENFDTVIHVPGNHEYWKVNNVFNTISETETYMEQLCDEYGVIFAQKKIIELRPSLPKLVCCTLWSKTSNNIGKSNDFFNIRGLNIRSRNSLYYDHLKFIKDSIRNEPIPPIIVTHHAPLSQNTQRTEHVGNHNQSLYTNNLGYLVDKSCAWIFGHTHHVCDIIRPNGTVVSSNPIGHITEKLPYNTSAILSIKHG